VNVLKIGTAIVPLPLEEMPGPYPGRPPEVPRQRGQPYGSWLPGMVEEIVGVLGLRVNPRQIATLLNRPDVRAALGIEECSYAALSAVHRVRGPWERAFGQIAGRAWADGTLGAPQFRSNRFKTNGNLEP
jgi:hypothetical protein